MADQKVNIIARLQQEILPLQGLKVATGAMAVDFGLGSLNEAFPNKSFPIGAMHEFISTNAEDKAVTSGFISCLLATLMARGGIAIWIGTSKSIFPTALKAFGITPDHILFVDHYKEKELLWVMEECLKCEGLAAVVGEIQDISFTASRRLQLAVEQSRVTGFILRRQMRSLNTIAAVSRWRIRSLPSEPGDGLPGLGFPRWNVELLKIRNGKTGNWQMEWVQEKFRHILPLTAVIPGVEKRKAG